MAIKPVKKVPGYKGEGKTSIQHPDKSVEEEIIPVGDTPKPKKPLAHPSVSLGMTLPTGNYSNVRLEVGLSLPCEIEELDEVYDYMLGWVDERLTKLHKTAKDAYGLGK